MTEQYTPRENITDYLVELINGKLILLPSPVDWKEGEEMCKSEQRFGGIDINKLCEMICDDTGITKITYGEVYSMCERILQMEEANPGSVFPK